MKAINYNGISKEMWNGQVATVINYKNYADYDVQFEDGTIVHNRSFSNFKRGKITNPNHHSNKIIASQKKVQSAKHRIGLTKTMNNGQSATIIEYQDCDNITLQFEDGTIVQNKRISSFNKGNVENPNYRYTGTSYIEEAFGYYFSQLCFGKIKKGELENFGFGKKELDLANFTIFDDELKAPKSFNNKLIAIEVDGYAPNHTRKIDKVKNKICKNNNINLIRIRTANVEKMKSYGNVKVFNISSGKPSLQEIKKTVRNIVKYINELTNGSFEIKFSKNEEEDFKEINSLLAFKGATKVGTVAIMNCGEKAEITEYFGSDDITVHFISTGTILRHKKLSHFNNGEIKDPYLLSFNRIGETKMMKNGIAGKIISYKNCKNIDVEFENGYIAYNKSYSDFQHGKIACFVN